MEGVNDSSGILVVEAVSMARPGRCPNCREQARRVHSTYQRTLDERPLGSRRVIIRLRVRRYFCDRRSCSRTTFVERVRGLSARYRRSSTGLAGWLQSVAIELGRPSRGTVIEVGAAQPEQRTVPLAVPPSEHRLIHGAMHAVCWLQDEDDEEATP